MNNLWQKKWGGLVHPSDAAARVSCLLLLFIDGFFRKVWKKVIENVSVGPIKSQLIDWLIHLTDYASRNIPILHFVSRVNLNFFSKFTTCAIDCNSTNRPKTRLPQLPDTWDTTFISRTGLHESDTLSASTNQRIVKSVTAKVATNITVHAGWL